MNNTVKMFLKLLLAAPFAIGLDIIVPFSTFGLSFVQANGKVLLFVIAVINAFISGGIGAGFLDKGVKSGFSYWRFPLSVEGELNPAYGFGGLSLLISVLWTILIQP